MTSQLGQDPHTQTFRLELDIFGETVRVEGAKPAGRIRLDELLPFFRTLDDEVIDRAARRAEAQGKRVSCRKGCSACCRAQPVPVTPAEAYALLRLVEALPEARQSAIRQRFAERVQRLREAGLLEVYRDRVATTTADEARGIAERYFRLALECPFLEDDACSIYPDRPFVCRQYLVTSPAQRCRDPFNNPIEQIAMPLAPATASLQTGEEVIGRPQFSVPLVLALGVRRDSPDRIGNYLRRSRVVPALSNDPLGPHSRRLDGRWRTRPVNPR